MKATISAIIAVVLLGAGAYFIVSNGDDDTITSNSSSTTQRQNETTQEAPSDEQATEGYITYSDENIEKTKNTSQVVFFHASWCSTCRDFEEQIEQSGVPVGVTVLKVDYDENTALKQKYSVRTQATFVFIDENGNAKQSWPFGQGLQNDIANLYAQVN